MFTHKKTQKNVHGARHAGFTAARPMPLTAHLVITVTGNGNGRHCEWTRGVWMVTITVIARLDVIKKKSKVSQRRQESERQPLNP
jgi:hypothetical protein